MLTLVLIILVGLYCLEAVFFRRGLAESSAIPVDSDAEPTVSVIIAARNEEHRILECLQSLRTIEYPPGKLEILIIDDFSTDRTAEIVAGFIGERTDMKLLKSPPESGNLRGKTNAIAQGIRNSRGEIIMFTDADCAVSPGWVRGTVKYFSENTGIVGGFTILDSRTTFHGIQALDWLYLFGVASALSGLRIPLTAIGNNLSVRRTAYLETGGYEVIPFSVTEDYSLVETIIRKTGYTMRFPLERDAIVTSRACDTLSQLVRQKQRWGVGALDMTLPGMAIFTLGWLVRAAVLLGFIFSTPMVSITALLAVLLADAAFLAKIFGALPFGHVRKHFPAFECYMTAYGLLIPFLAFGSRNIVWKERTLRRDKKNAFQSERHS